MIELPEAHVLARQMSDAFAGRTIVAAEAHHSPHRVAF